MSELHIKSLTWKYKGVDQIKVESINSYLSDKLCTVEVNMDIGVLELVRTEVSDMLYDEENNTLILVDNTDYWFSYLSSSNFVASELITNVLGKAVDGKGILNSKNYVGTLEFGIDAFNIIVKSKKVNYDRDFEYLRTSISSFCNDLLSRSSSFYSEHFSKSDKYVKEKINYSEVAYLRAMLSPDKFQAWIDYLVNHPEHKFDKDMKKKDCGEIDEIDVEYYLNALADDNIQKSSRISGNIGLAPIEMMTDVFSLTYDIPENRFVKFFLESLVEYIEEISSKCDENNVKLKYEVTKIKQILDDKLQYPFWKNISNLDRIPFNSQVLQKKYPYNMIFQMYTEFEMESRIDLGDIDKQFAVGQKDAPILYQYWVFIMIFQHLAKRYRDKYITSEWLSYDGKNLAFTLREGRRNYAKFDTGEDTEIHLLYNKTYDSNHSIYSGRSYSHELKPDISLELFREKKLIAIIHFDAKYRLPINGTDVPDDINKMHAYKDGIIGTVGAYAVCLADDPILYKEEEKDENSSGLFPSVGACPLNLKPENLEKELNNIMYIVDEFTQIDYTKTAASYSRDHLKRYYALARKLMEVKE